jgi:hypothetical protein
VAATDARSLQQIRRDTEQARAGLTNTVEQLRSTVSETASDIRQRISPDAIKAEVGDYFRSRGEQLLDTVTSAARRNPLQAVAVGASVAYPLMRLTRSIPVPILMVGAGLFLAGSKTGQAVTQTASDAASDLADEAGRRAHDLKQSFDETVAAARDYGADKVAGLTEAVAARTGDLKDEAGRTFLETVEQNPLVVGGIGLLIGGLIASALPRSDLEDTFAGEVGGEIKSRVRDAASKGADAARDVASGVYDDVARRAEEQGLTPDHLDAAASDFGQRLRKVAEAAVTTAFDPDAIHSNETGGGTEHG